MLSKIWKVIKKLFISGDIDLPGQADDVVRMIASGKLAYIAVEDWEDMQAAMRNVVTRLSHLEEKHLKAEGKLDQLWDKAYKNDARTAVMKAPDANPVMAISMLTLVDTCSDLTLSAATCSRRTLTFVLISLVSS